MKLRKLVLDTQSSYGPRATYFGECVPVAVHCCDMRLVCDMSGPVIIPHHIDRVERPTEVRSLEILVRVRKSLRHESTVMGDRGNSRETDKSAVALELFLADSLEQIWPLERYSLDG